MLRMITLSISSLLIVLTGWTLTTYFIKKKSQELIREELNNLFDICKKFFISLKNLIGLLVSNSLSPDSSEANQLKSKVSDEDKQPLKLVQTVKEIEEPSLKVANEEDDDIALSSFSPEVIEVIKEEEEKVA